MKTDKYTQVFEDETRGTMNRPNKYILNIFIVTIFTMIICITLLYKSGDKIYPTTNLVSTDSNLKNELNIQNLDKVPTLLPSRVPSFLKDENNKWKKSRYPTYSYNPSQNILQPSYIPYLTNPSIENSEYSSKTPIISVTDDFHITPIIVVNYDKKEVNPSILQSVLVSQSASEQPMID